MDIRSGFPPVTFPEIMDEQLEILATIFRQTWNKEPEYRPDIQDFLLLLNSAFPEESETQIEYEGHYSMGLEEETEAEQENEQALDTTSSPAANLELTPQNNEPFSSPLVTPEESDNQEASKRVSYTHTQSDIEYESDAVGAELEGNSAPLDPRKSIHYSSLTLSMTLIYGISTSAKVVSYHRSGHTQESTK
jgi:hypothetical protein